MNINRDYLIINDVKKSNIKLDNGSMFFYITDKNTQNIFVNLVINVSNNDLIQKYANIENAEDYTLTMNIVKPDNTYKVVEGKLHDKEKAIFEFNLEEECVDKIGPYRCELLTKCNINGHEEITTSNKLTYKVKSSILNDLDDIVEAPEYPLVIQLFDKLSDIEQYEEDRRANELARQLAEEQRQTRFDVLDTDMTDRIKIIDDKLVEIDNALISKEDIADIKTKNTEQDRRLDVAENRLDNINTNIENVLQPTVQRVDAIEAINATQNNKLDAIEAKNTQQDNRLDVAENRLANIDNDITNTMQPIIDEHTSRLDAIEAIDVSQNTRLDAIEAKNQQQDDRLLDIEKVNKKQDIDIKCLFNFHTVDITEEGNSIYLPNSAEGYCEIDNIQGNTLVNYNKEPDKELILNGNINTQGYSNVTLTEGVDGGLVDVALEGNTMVNICDQKDPVALPCNKELTYLYANTLYVVQFVSDAASKVNITLGGAELLNQDVVLGINKYTITTPSKLIDNNLVLNGEGFNASNIVVTEATDQDFGYFEGMKSVGECEDLAVVSSNSDGSQSNTQQLTHEPLRAVGDIKDRYVLIDGKWYIERNCGYRNNYSICDAWSNENLTNKRLKLFKLDNSIEEFDDMNALRKVKSNKFKCVQYGYTDGRFNVPFLAYITENGNLWVSADINYTQQDTLNYIKDCQFVYELPSPTYEPIDYNPFTVYSDTTHISNNSTIPANMTIKNTGYNCLLKPSTTYTVSSNLGLNTVTTPSVLTEDCLRFYDTDTSTVTTMNNITILEGDYTTGKPLPSHFSGIESAFEQEYDEAAGKYKVKIRIQNEDASKENYIEFYINEPLRGIGDVKDRVYVKNDKVVVERKCGSVTFDGSEDGWYIWENNTNCISFAIINNWNMPAHSYLEACNYIYTDKFIRKTYTKNLEWFTSHCYPTIKWFAINLLKAKLQTQDVEGFKQWLQQNPTTVVYQLAEPTYEEVEYNDVKLFIESFKNSTLFYNSNIPVTSTVHYSYSVPLVDTVAQTADISNQQDSMIIDLATQCAIMEMYLM